MDCGPVTFPHASLVAISWCESLNIFIFSTTTESGVQLQELFQPEKSIGKRVVGILKAPVATSKEMPYELDLLHSWIRCGLLSTVTCFLY